jgi:hypothetical protein
MWMMALIVALSIFVQPGGGLSGKSGMERIVAAAVDENPFFIGKSI